MTSKQLPASVASASILLYWNEIASKLVAKTGIPTDSYHIGKLILNSFREEPNFVLQVDGITHESITFKQAEEMSVRCAYAFRKMGLKKGDVILIMSNNNIHVSIPHHAAMYEGIVIAALHTNLSVFELTNAFKVVKPKLIISISERVEDIQTALKAVNNDAEVITYDKGTVRTLDDLIKTSNESIGDYKPADFNPADELAIIIPTSGTTGLPKYAAVSYKALLLGSTIMWIHYDTFPYPTANMMLNPSVFQWISSHLSIVSTPLVRVTRLMSYMPFNRQTAAKMINKYRPAITMMGPGLLNSLLKDDESGLIDFTCFENILLGGSPVYRELINEFNALSPRTLISVGYGITEGVVVTATNTPIENGVGPLLGFVKAQLVDPDTEEVIREPNKPGMIWIKSPCVFKGYYNNPEATKDVFSKDGWFKTGDILYEDENRNFHFVDRAKQMLKYRDQQVAPTEVESVILKHPAVEAAAVVGKRHQKYGDLILAFVVRKPGAQVSAQDIKDIVAKYLSEAKHLSGGVIFLDQIPLTPTHKVNRSQLIEMAKTMHAE